jgi:hypothetical protein
MFRKKSRWLFLLVVGVAILMAFVAGDDVFIQKIASQLAQWSANQPIEKVYLQLDKPTYAAGDDIWFKAYITFGGSHQLSGLSGIVNVELIDNRDSIIQHIKLPAKSGLAWGDLALADTLQEGNYRIRAYTNYMRNAGEDYFFDQHIAIVNAVNNKVFTKAVYTFSVKNGEHRVNASINYTDSTGTPYAGKAVRYKIELSPKTIIEGKGITDDNGKLIISFTNTPPHPYYNSKIITTLLIGKNDPAIKVIPIKATSDNVDIQFFPESGNLVDGIRSKIAFKAVGADGLGAEIKGTVLDDKNNTVATFNTQHLGMGVFEINPFSGISYKAHITLADGSEKNVDLPAVKDKGYGLAIDMDDPQLVKIKIFINRQQFENSPDTLNLVAQSGGHIYYTAKCNSSSRYFTANIPRSKFPSGIVQFTLFSSKGEPINERLVFIQNPDQLTLNVSSKKQTYASREKVEIKLNATKNAKPVVGSFSVAVTDETRVPVDDNAGNNISTNLLLTSDLRGYIEKPNYYFNHGEKNAAADLDVLMLTQGYHRFEWKEILTGNYPPLTFKPEKVLEISGHLTARGKPIEHGRVSLLSSQGFLDTVTNESGQFDFKDLSFMGPLKITILAKTEKDNKNVKITLDNIIEQQVSQNKTTPDWVVNVNADAPAYLQSSKAFYDEEVKYGLATHTRMLKQVTIRDTKPVITHSSNLNGPGNADQVLTGNEIPRGFSSITAALTGRLMGVRVVGKPTGGGFQQSFLNLALGKPMTVSLDGIIIPNDEIALINPSDVESVEVLSTIANFNTYLNKAGPGGVIIITTKNADDYAKDDLILPVPGAVVYHAIGYYKARQFYSPQYDDPKTNTAVADLRSTIYWNPDVITDKNGNASFNYFNAGGKGTYRVVIEGMDAEGHIGRYIYRYKVE